MIWYVHRPAGPGTPISWAGEYEQPGYADEPLDDATSTELAAFLAATAPKPIPPSPRVWLERLAPATQAAITAAAAKDTSGALLLWLLKAAGNGAPIDVTATETVAGVAALHNAGIISADDVATLLAP